jgi:diguanylate cyclase (GGDEF)-like protein
MFDPILPSLDSRIDAYTGWVKQLRRGVTDLPRLADDHDPLARLGHELELLSQSLAHRKDELLRLLDIVQTVERGVLLDDVLNAIYEAFRGVIPFDRIGCAFLTEDHKRLVAYWARSTLGLVRIDRGYSMPMAGSSLERVLATQRPRVINDLAAYLEAKPNSDSTRRIVAEGGRSSLTCPLIVNSQPRGFLFFTSATIGAYGEAHQAIYEMIASQVALVIDKSRAYTQIIDDNKALQARGCHLETIAAHDALTGVLNRGTIDAALAGALADYQRDGSPFGVIMVDIDRFKVVNDTYGHAMGDAVLQEFAARTSSAVRETDAVGRYGGEEFLVVVRNAEPAEVAEIAERIRCAAQDKRFALKDSHLDVTASLGVAWTLGGAEDVAAIMKRADAALYRAKASGRNRVVLDESDNPGEQPKHQSAPPVAREGLRETAPRSALM